jgi:hypothetical protein
VGLRRRVGLLSTTGVFIKKEKGKETQIYNDQRTKGKAYKDSRCERKEFKLSKVRQ